MFAGDPVAGTGWLDSNPSDRRMILSVGPFTMGPAHVQEIVLAIIMARGADRLDSIVQLRAFDQVIQTAFDTGTLDNLAVPSADSSPLSLAPPWPNPARGSISLSVSLAEEGEVQLDVVDVTGRRVLQRSLGQLEPGPHVFPLDPLRERLTPGLYFVQITQGSTTVSRRLALLH
jgi:type IX secretion system substrate protein